MANNYSFVLIHSGEIFQKLAKKLKKTHSTFASHRVTAFL